VHPAERETARLTCRRPRPEDEPAYRALLTAPEVNAWLRPPPLAPYDEGSSAQRLGDDLRHWDRHGFGPWMLVERATATSVGRGGLAWTTVVGEQVVEVAWAIQPARWGEGLATEAARAALEVAADLGLEVVSFTQPGNAASRRVMERLGLRLDREIEHRGLPHVLYRATGSAGRSR
jgi:RimJ/RimL family protein N-acetyltransferase